MKKDTGCPFEFDPYAEATLAARPEAYAELGQKCPVHHYQGRFEFFIASDRVDVTKGLLKDT